MAGYELATAYVNLIVETGGAGKEIGSLFKGVEGDADRTGRGAGQKFAKAFSSAKPIDLKDDAEKAAAQVDVASKKVEQARSKEEAAARKVAIEEAKLQEQRESGNTKASTILATEDRLARAKDASALASMNVESAVQSEAEAKTRAIAANDQLEASQREAGDAAEDTGQKYMTLKDRIKAAVSGDFKGAFSQIPEEAEDAAEDVPEKFDGVGQSSASKFGAAFKRMLGPILAAISAGAIVKVGFQGAMDLQNSTKTLTGLYDSASEANDMMRMLKSVAKDSPLELSGYSSAAETLAYAGVQGEKAAGVLENVGKAIVTAGGDTTKLDQAMGGLLKGVNNGGIAMMDSLGMISESGVPILSGLAAKFGTTTDEIKKMASGSQISVEDVLDVMQNGTGETFEQMIDASGVASSSLQNQWKTAKDRISVSLGEAFQPLMERVAPMIGPITDKIANGISAIVTAIMEVAGWMERWKSVIGPTAAALGGVALAIGVYALATNAATIASNLAASAFWKMTAAFLASPMGWLVIAIGAVVGALTWFFTKTETGAALWDTIWGGIKTAAAAVFDWFQAYIVPLWNTTMSALGTALQWLWGNVLKPVFGFIGALVVAWWNNILKPQFNALVAIWRNVIAPALQWLWNSVFKPLFGFIGTMITVWWNNVLKPIFNALVAFWKNVLSPTLTWLKNTFQAIFLLIGALIKAWWNNVVKPTFDIVVNFLKKTLGPVFQWLYDRVIKPVWDGIGTLIKNTWNNVIKPIFDTLANFIQDKVAPKFEKGVDAIGKAWDGLKEAAKKPVKFVINKVINEGVIDRFNAIADKFPGTKTIKPLSLPKGWATGGWTGPGAKLKPAGIVHADEFVVRKAARRKFERQNPGVLDHVNRTGSLPAFGGYATGGRVGGTLMDAADWWIARGARASRHSRFNGGKKITSGHSPNSLHYQDRAVDLNKQGTSGESAAEKAFFDRHVAEFKSLFPGIRVIWRAPNHYDHMHIDTGRGADIGDTSGGGMGVMDMLLSPFNKLKEKLTEQFEKFGQFGSLAKGAGQAAIEAPIEWIKSNISKVTDFFEGAASGFVDTVGTRAAKELVRPVAMGYGWGSGSEWDAIVQLVQKESSWDPSAANPTTSARGLFQKMTSLHGPVERTAAGQAGWGLKYIKDRYGTPSRALAFHNRNNWYDRGGRVVPKYDNGGLLKRGVQLIEHGSSKPDRVLTERQWEGIYEAAQSNTASGASFHFTTPVVERNEVAEWVDAAEFAFRHMSKSNAFSGVNG